MSGSSLGRRLIAFAAEHIDPEVTVHDWYRAMRGNVRMSPAVNRM